MRNRAFTRRMECDDRTTTDTEKLFVPMRVIQPLGLTALNQIDASKQAARFFKFRIVHKVKPKAPTWHAQNE